MSPLRRTFALPPKALVPVAFLAVVLIWGSTFLAIRVAIDTIPPLLMAGMRYVLAGAGLYAAARAFGVPRPTRRAWLPALLTGALMLGIGNGGVTWAEQTVPSGLAALFMAAIPAWMVALDAARPGGRRPSARALLGIALGFTGVAVLVGPGLGPVAPDALTAAVLVAGPIAWAVGSTLAPRSGLPASLPLAAAMQMLAGGGALLLAGLLTGEGARFAPSAVSSASLGGFVYLVLVGSVVGFSAYAYLLRHASPSRVGAYAFLNPVVALLLGWALAGESVGAMTLVAGALVIAGAALLTTGGGRASRHPRGGTAGRAEPVDAGRADPA